MAKKRAHGEGSIYQLADGRWRASISLPGGKRPTSPRFATRAEAVAWMTQARGKRARGVAPGDGRQRTDAWLDAWLESHVRGTVRPRTQDSYAYHIRSHLRPTIGHDRLVDLDPTRMRALVAALAARGLDSDTIRRAFVVLRRALADAVADGLVERNVAKMIRLPRATPRVFEPPSPETMRALIVAAAGHRVMEAFIPLAVATGLRHGELLALTWDRLALSDRDNATLGVVSTMHRRQGAGMEARETKTIASRKTVPVPASIVDILIAHRGRQGRERLAAGDAWEDHGLVFTTIAGRPIDGTNNLKVFHRLQDKAGLPRCRIHDLRHAFVTYLLALGEDLRTIMDLARHGSIHVTMNTYAHVMPAAGRAAAARMDGLLTGRIDASGNPIAANDAADSA